jgi:hypothetical protein
MALFQFTWNHNHDSTDKGFQFEFMCDLCGNGFMNYPEEGREPTRKLVAERKGAPRKGERLLVVDYCTESVNLNEFCIGLAPPVEAFTVIG